MTQAELDALPIVDGVAMFQGLADGAVVDGSGVRWMIGWVDGVRSKQRMLSQGWLSASDGDRGNR